MILVADSGSTKTDWRLIQKDKVISQHECKGLNPHFHSSESIYKEIVSSFEKSIVDQVKEIHFYGSGSSTEEKQNIVHNGLSQFFVNTNIHVHHDLLGAARASCGTEPGLSGILGTGSNCCLYNGQEITQEFRSGGFMIGDEGGGVQIGKMVLKNYIEQTFPIELTEKFEKRYNTSYDEILTNLYKRDYPNRYMASFSRFAYHNRENLFVQDLILTCFRSYFETQVKRFPNFKSLPLSLVGSIAFYYQDIIRAVAEEYEVRIGTILEKPISGIANYHIESL